MRRTWIGAACLGFACSVTGCQIGDTSAFDSGFFTDDDSGISDGKDAGPISGHDSGLDGGTLGRPDGGDAGADSGKSRDHDWPGNRAQATCDALLDCIGNAELLADTLGGRDCERLYESKLLNGDTLYVYESLVAGRISYGGPDVGVTCLADIRKQGCAVITSRLPASCELALNGTVALGKDCTINDDCAGDAYCAKGALPTCPGVCAPLRTEDMTCTSNDDEQCDDGLICSGGTCKSLGVLNQACGTGLPKCNPGLVCFDPGTGAVCSSLATLYFKKLGQACDVQSALCEPGLVCESVSGTSGKCAMTVGKGSSCKRAQPNQCPIDQYCNAAGAGTTGKCVDRPGDGVSCLTGRSQQCADGALCINGTCRKLSQPGEACVDDAQCYSGTCGDDAKCAAPLMCKLP